MDNNSQFLIYNTEDGQDKVEILLNGDTAWMTQAQLAELFETTISNINIHIKNIFEDGELDSNSVIKDYLITAEDGKAYQTKHYNLDMILSIGYRVRSKRGVQFRKWANSVLKEYLTTGYALDNAKLKDGGDPQYFKNLLSEIRDIRSSEKVLYGQLLDIFKLSIDYDKNSTTAKQFFTTVQNKLHVASSGMTAAEIIMQRANAELPYMGLTNFHGNKPHKQDVQTAKNYLTKEELDQLNLITSGFLDFAEARAKRQEPTKMAQWVERLDLLLQADDRQLSDGIGTRSRKQANEKAVTEFQKYNKRVRNNGLSEAERDFLETIKKLK